MNWYSMLDFFLGKPVYEKRTVSYGKKRFKVEVADSVRKRMKGLMGRAGLPRDGGMLFIFGAQGRYGFWMAGMKFSIDIIWLDKEGTVVHIARNAAPCTSMIGCKTVMPGKDAIYVLELGAGTAKKLGIKVGSRFSL